MRLYNPLSFTGNGRAIIAQMFCLSILYVLGVAIFGASTEGGVVFANVIGTVASGVGTSTTFNGFKSIPQFLIFEIATTPQAIKVNINGRILTVDLDTAGINALCNPRVYGKPANGFILPISNGLQTEFTMDITVTNGVATAFDLLAISKDNAPVDAPGFYTNLKQTINQGVVQLFDDFTYLSLPSMTINDTLQIVGNKKDSQGNYAPGQWSTRTEFSALRNLLGQYENNTTLAKLAIDNYNREYQQLYFTPAASQAVYVQRLVSTEFRGAVIGG